MAAGVEVAVGSTGVVGFLTFAGIMAAQPFGLQVQSIIIGSGFAALGVIGKSAWELQTALERQDPIRGRRILGWVGAGLIGAPFTSVLWLIVLKTMGVPADNVAIMGLVFLGFLGPKGLSWVLDKVPALLGKAMPGGGNAPPPNIGATNGTKPNG